MLCRDVGKRAMPGHSREELFVGRMLQRKLIEKYFLSCQELVQEVFFIFFYFFYFFLLSFFLSYEIWYQSVPRSLSFSEAVHASPMVKSIDVGIVEDVEECSGQEFVFLIMRDIL